MLIDFEKAHEMGILPARVFVDGVEAPFCSAFDMDEGYAIIQETDSSGQIIVENGNVKTRRINGVVTYEKIHG